MIANTRANYSKTQINNNSITKRFGENNLCKVMLGQQANRPQITLTLNKIVSNVDLFRITFYKSKLNIHPAQSSFMLFAIAQRIQLNVKQLSKKNENCF